MILRVLGLVMLSVTAAFSQVPRIEPGVSPELAKWRAAHYSDVRYKLNLTLEKMSPVLKGTIEVRVNYVLESCSESAERYLILDWRKIAGHEKDSTISNVTLNGKPERSWGLSSPDDGHRTLNRQSGFFEPAILSYEERNDHITFRDGVVPGENVIKLDFTSPILTSGSAITRYVDKEDGEEYIYSHFTPSDASTAFPVFDQPDLKARFTLSVELPSEWSSVSNTNLAPGLKAAYRNQVGGLVVGPPNDATFFTGKTRFFDFDETKPISTYAFAFAAGPWTQFEEPGTEPPLLICQPGTTCDSLLRIMPIPSAHIYVRKTQGIKFQPQAAEVFRLQREAIKYHETYFGNKFPFPKYDLVLIPEFPFGVTDGAGVAFLRESSVVLPAKPTTKGTTERALAILHATARQWTGEKALSSQLDQLWLKKVLPNLQPEQAR